MYSQSYRVVHFITFTWRHDLNFLTTTSLTCPLSNAMQAYLLSPFKLRMQRISRFFSNISSLRSWSSLISCSASLANSMSIWTQAHRHTYTFCIFFLFCCCTASMEQATDGAETAAIDGVVSSWSENIFCLNLSTGTKIQIDFVMRPRSSSRGRNTSASLTVTSYRHIHTVMEHTVIENNGSHSLAYKQIPGLFKDIQNVYPRLCRSPVMLNYRQTAVTYSVYTVWHYNPSQNVYHKLQKNCSVSIWQEYFIHLFTHGVLYIKGMLIKLNHR